MAGPTKPTRALPIVGRLGPASIADAVHRAAAGMLRERATASELAEQALAWCADTVAEAKRRFPPDHPTGCSEGCAYCCHLKVIATPAEVVAIAELLRRRLSAGELAALTARVAALAEATRALTTGERAERKLACPLLAGGRCSVYEVRPLHCAGANAFDPASCARAFDDPASDHAIAHYPAQRLTAGATMAGLSRALLEGGLDGRPLELVAGLAVALSDETATERWRAGEPAFEAAVDRELEGLLSPK